MTSVPHSGAKSVTPGGSVAGHTPGPWRSIIDDTGGQWSGWPLCVCPVGDDDRSVVRTGGQWPYEWDAHTSQAEAVANARLIAASPAMYDYVASKADAGDEEALKIVEVIHASR